MSIDMTPIGQVHSPRRELTDDQWGSVTSTIEIDAMTYTADAVLGLDAFSHIEVIYLFHRVATQQVLTAAEHPRENPAWPRVGIFAQRKKNRPNRIGLSVCRLVRVEGLTLTVEGLDAIDGTPVLDIKPYVREFAPLRESVRQPAWMSELMKDYF